MNGRLILVGLLLWFFSAVLILLHEFGAYLGGLIKAAGLTPADIGFMPWLIVLTLVVGFLFVLAGATQGNQSSSDTSSF